MALTKRQREQLLAIMRPLITDTVQSAVSREIEQQHRSAESTGYLGKILGARDPGQQVRSKELPYAARVFARLGLIQAASQGDRSTAFELAQTLDVSDEYKKAMSAGSAEGGGLLIADDMADDLIELLRPFSVMRRIGAIEVPIPKGTKRTPRIDTGTVSGYVGEGEAIPTSDMKTGAVVLVARKCATLVVFSNELSTFTLDERVFNADQIIVNDMLAAMGQAEDVAFLLGSGSEAEPLGIVLQTAPANKFDATQAGASATLTEVQGDLRKAEQALLSANVPMLRPVWIMSPRSRLFLRDIRDTDDRGVFGAEMAASKTINGIPYFETNNVPNNLGSGDDESFIILVDAAQVMLGDVQQVSVDRSNQATVKIDGVDTNLFSTDRSAIRVRQFNDIRLRHSVGAAVIEAVKWGA
ncbi:MAG TPA: phage major capsid protein [Gammaproteobacteria bacterium]|nr:phage major capsid protein [Gammaproteobacteria bacterium]